VLRVGVTGGIGAGKSTAAKQLVRSGGFLVDADQVAREVVVPGGAGLLAVVEEFGDRVLLPDGTLDRPGLGRIIFGDRSSRLRLNAILHPLIAARTTELIATAPPDVVVIHEHPLIVENGLAASYHLVVVVDAPEQLRAERLVEHRGMAANDAWQRIRAQATDQQRRAAADVLLDNSGDVGPLVEATQSLYAQRLAPFEQNVRGRHRAGRPPLVEVVEPEPTWPDQARRLLGRIGAVAGGRAIRLDHTGSTSVPGLPAKDIVDLQLVVADLAVADQLCDPLQDAGFARLPGDWWDDALDGGSPPKRLHLACDPGRAVNLHVRTADSPAVREQLVFRDWLRQHPAERDAYAGVKRGAAGVELEPYLDAKGPWIRAALLRALAWDDGRNRWTEPRL
jgi:dephospho-CoA kinase